MCRGWNAGVTETRSSLVSIPIFDALDGPVQQLMQSITGESVDPITPPASPVAPSAAASRLLEPSSDDERGSLTLGFEANLAQSPAHCASAWAEMEEELG